MQIKYILLFSLVFELFHSASAMNGDRRFIQSKRYTGNPRVLIDEEQTDEEHTSSQPHAAVVAQPEDTSKWKALLAIAVPVGGVALGLSALLGVLLKSSSKKGPSDAIEEKKDRAGTPAVVQGKAKWETMLSTLASMVYKDKKLQEIEMLWKPFNVDNPFKLLNDPLFMALLVTPSQKEYFLQILSEFGEWYFNRELIGIFGPEPAREILKEQKLHDLDKRFFVRQEQQGAYQKLVQEMTLLYMLTNEGKAKLGIG